MVRRKLAGMSFVALTAGLLFAPAVWAQQASGIAGVVRDTSGAVIPGVTVEAASPALIEKVRTVVTDGDGRYNIVDLSARYVFGELHADGLWLLPARRDRVDSRIHGDC